MVDKIVKPCFDSSVFIAGLNKEIKNGIKRGVTFKHLWSKAEEREFPVLISAVALAEVYKKRKFGKLADEAYDEFLECINKPFVEVIEVDRETGLLAHALCRKFSQNKLMPADAIHLACALRAKCDVLLAWDGPLTSVRHDGIAICEPRMFGKNLLSDSETATSEEESEYENQIAAIAEEEAVALPSEVRRSDLGRSEGEARGNEEAPEE